MITRILVALDHTHRAPFVLSAATEIAVRFDARLRLFRAIPLMQEFPAAASNAGTRDPLPEFLRSEALDQMRTLAAGNERASDEPPIIAFGHPADLILDAADEAHADLIVIGSHGFHGIDRIFGTVAGRIANRAKRNVFVVHSYPFESIPPLPGH